uniref:DDE Tnp4 domain-containing protein n=1 Tax=Ditylenchus dipsaci TaxID=166011 RepID=A0A915DUP0_9BILA
MKIAEGSGRGCIDGKHVQITKPDNSGSLFYNYKGTFSTVLMAVCDYKYKIHYADFGSYGHESDAGWEKKLKGEEDNYRVAAVPI